MTLFIGMRVNQAKGLFFDSSKVKQQTSKAERQVLSRFGAFVRTRVRSMIRKRRAPSAPGQPPSSHTGLLKRFIYFVYDAARRSVIIGPIRLASKRGDAPELLEEGGLAVRRGKPAAYRPRPYMGPAFSAELPRVPAMWRDAVK